MAISFDNIELFEDIKGKVHSIHLETSFLNKNTDQEKLILKGQVNSFPVEILLDGKQVYDFDSYSFTKFPNEIADLKKDVFNIINRYYLNNY